MKNNDPYDKTAIEIALEKVFDSENEIQTFENIFERNFLRESAFYRTKENGFPLFNKNGVTYANDYLEYLKDILHTDLASHDMTGKGDYTLAVHPPTLEIVDDIREKLLEKKEEQLEKLLQIHKKRIESDAIKAKNKIENLTLNQISFYKPNTSNNEERDNLFQSADYTNDIGKNVDQDILDFSEASLEHTSNIKEDNTYTKKMCEVLKDLSMLHKKMTGQKPSFKDVMDAIIILEPKPGKTLFSKTGGIGIAVHQWKKIHEKFEGKIAKPFDKVELQKVYNDLINRVDEVGSYNKAIECYKNDIIQDSFVVQPITREIANKALQKELELYEEGIYIFKEVDELRHQDFKAGMPPRVGLPYINYSISRDHNGNPVKEIVDTNARKNKNKNEFLEVDPSPLLDPNVTDNEIHELEIEIIDEFLWDKVPTVASRDEDGETQITSFKNWLEAREKEYPNFRNTLEFKKRVPIYLKKNGKRVAFLHDSEWFNGFNIKSPGGAYEKTDNYKENNTWKKKVDDAHDRNLKLRLKILNSDNNITSLSYKSDGNPKYCKLGNDQNELPYKVADPNAIVVPLLRPTLNNLDKILNALYDDDSFKNGDKILVNSKEDMDRLEKGYEGHIYALRRVGSRKINGKKVETYYLEETLYYNIKKEFESIKYLFKHYKELKNLRENNVNNSRRKFLEDFNIEAGKYKIANIDSMQGVANYVGSLYKINYEELHRINKLESGYTTKEEEKEKEIEKSRIENKNSNILFGSFFILFVEFILLLYPFKDSSSWDKLWEILFVLIIASIIFLFSIVVIQEVVPFIFGFFKKWFTGGLNGKEKNNALILFFFLLIISLFFNLISNVNYYEIKRTLAYIVTPITFSYIIFYSYYIIRTLKGSFYTKNDSSEMIIAGATSYFISFIIFFIDVYQLKSSFVSLLRSYELVFIFLVLSLIWLMQCSYIIYRHYKKQL